MELFTPWHLVILAIVAAVLFFGWKQLPDMARSLGRSLRVFKTEIKGMADDDKTRDAAKAEPAAIEPPAAEPVAKEPVAKEPVAKEPVRADVVKRSPRPSPTPNGRSGTPAAGA